MPDSGAERRQAYAYTNKQTSGDKEDAMYRHERGSSNRPRQSKASSRKLQEPDAERRNVAKQKTRYVVESGRVPSRVQMNRFQRHRVAAGVQCSAVQCVACRRGRRSKTDKSPRSPLHPSTTLTIPRRRSKNGNGRSLSCVFLGQSGRGE
ncbi:hypothetical protein BS50DRAFT_182521 [Corynespora cassiicola Philippines]|uniref:Uncharacterized protein n=1 Tax=Corynespora cassiicola Philippines TaxID=1448308 RepID=A0A2T2P6J5_CORCC|nr:hypothetical protein BS50DRAFT_182521 [Corynespora cassiicola Philippines]